MPAGTTAKGQTPDGKKVTVGLENAAQNWPSPTARDHKGGGKAVTRPDGKSRMDMLDWAAENWPTPDAGIRGGINKSPSGGASERPTLATLSEAWATPRMSDGDKGSPNSRDSSGSAHLTNQSANWQTPRACTGERSSGMNRTELVEAYQSPRQAPETSRDGKTSLKKRLYLNRRSIERRSGELPGGSLQKEILILENMSIRARLAGWRKAWTGERRKSLNPLFVEWLMGWPIGWTACECSVTAFTHWQQRMRSELSMLVSRQGTTSSTQFDLFEDML